jgi:protein-L-isoaspartate(D-aspartate) O-methyltransferase
MAAQPILFTVAFRRKLAQLSPEQRREWLGSAAAKVRRPPPGTAGIATQELREVARGCRGTLAAGVERQMGPFDRRFLEALVEVPRERFVRIEDLERSAEDTPLPLDREGHATISAPHAYLLSYRLLRLTEGDSLVELGAGSGYGAALASYIVGPAGRIVSCEIDPDLAAWAKATLAGTPNVEVHCRDALASTDLWGGATKVVVTFAVESLPPAWLDRLPEGGLLVAPVGSPEKEQRLVLATKRLGRIIETEHGAVRYVKNRSTR